MKVSNKYRKKDFSYLLHNNLSQQKNDCNQTPIFNQYNSEEREKAIYRLYFCQGGKMLSEPEKRERKKVFKKLGFTNDLLDYRKQFDDNFSIVKNCRGHIPWDIE